jgi:hypothetical protein
MSKEEKSIQPMVTDERLRHIAEKIYGTNGSRWSNADRGHFQRHAKVIRDIYESSRAADKKRIEELEEVLKELADKSSMLLAFATANLPDDRLESYLMNYACDTEVATARYILTK